MMNCLFILLMQIHGVIFTKNSIFNYLGDLQMKKIITIALLTSVSLLAVESIDTNKSMMDVNTSTSTVSRAIDGAVFYKKRCSLCHGKEAKKTPLKGMISLAGTDASILARKIRAYRDQDEMYGIAHNVYENNQMMKDATYSLSDRHISAIAVYIRGLI